MRRNLTHAKAQSGKKNRGAKSDYEQEWIFRASYRVCDWSSGGTGRATALAFAREAAKHGTDETVRMIEDLRRRL